jgi:hypothetical protein
MPIFPNDFLQKGHMKEWVDLRVGREGQSVGNFSNLLEDLIRAMELGYKHLVAIFLEICFILGIETKKQLQSPSSK